MDSPKKPFICQFKNCESSFTNADHLEVHSKGHSMVLQLGLCAKSALFEADQTPTPTRLIRNCDEVGLFDDLHLHHVNPFEETFRRAVETKGLDEYSAQLPANDERISFSSIVEDTLHTPRVLLSQVPNTCKDDVNDNKKDSTKESEDLLRNNNPKARAKRKPPKLSSPNGSHNLRRVLPKCSNSCPTYLPIGQCIHFFTPHKFPSLSPNTNQTTNPRETQKHKSVREILKDQILRGKQPSTECELNKPQLDNVSKIGIYIKDTPVPPLKRIKQDISVKNDNQQRFERNNEAAKRYRCKMKQRNDETTLRNIKLEEENRRLKEELEQLRTILQAHQHCAITNAVSLGLNIPIGPPKIIFKHTKTPIATTSETPNTADL